MLRTNSSAAIDADAAILSAFIRVIRVICDSEAKSASSAIQGVCFRIADDTDDAEERG